MAVQIIGNNGQVITLEIPAERASRYAKDEWAYSKNVKRRQEFSIKNTAKPTNPKRKITKR